MELWGVPGEVLVQGGAVGVLLLAVLGIFTGRLVPASTVDRIEKVLTERLAEERARGDEWKASSEAQAARNDVLVQGLNDITEAGRTTNALVEGFKQAVEARQTETRRRP